MEYKGIVKLGDKVLLISSLQAQREQILKVHTDITSCIGEEGRLDLEQIERLSSVQLSVSSYDSIILPKFDDYSFNLDVQQLGQLLQGLKPKGKLHFYLTEAEQISTVNNLKVSGFTDVQTNPTKIAATKPDYEVGTSQSLKLNRNRNKDKPKVNLWDDEDDDDIIDDNDLIDEADFIKPDVASLARPDGSVVRKKACKNCSCGLAEIEAEEELQNLKLNGSKAKVDPIVLDTKDVKSSCGSCYLGDAFRCASCPYLGLPAFNPGEKVTLNASMLNDDIEL